MARPLPHRPCHRRLHPAALLIVAFTAAPLYGGDSAATASETSDRRDERDRQRLAVVRDWADRVLEQGTDRWSGENTPLLADGLHVHSLEPVVWRHRGNRYIISNLASQQNLFRTLAALSELTGEDRYERAAEAAVRYHFEHLGDRSGLLRWGGHQFIDLATLQPVGEFDADCHEFKNNFPFYELMWQVDADATTRFLRALWHAHVTNWRILDMNRHGPYGRALPEDIWQRPFDDPEPFFEGDGLTFINAGSDLIYAAGMLHQLADEPRAWTWGRRLARMYVKARHPETGLGAYQYSHPRRRRQPPAEGPLEGRLTWSMYGDRAENQFSAQFGEVAREGWAVWGGRIRTIYVRNGFMQLGLGEAMDEGEQLIEWTADGLEALATHAYMPEANAFRPMWADGTDLTGKTYDRGGYYGPRGTEWQPLAADVEFLMTYARAYRLTGREALWDTARRIGKGLGIGDIGRAPGEAVAMNLEAPGSSPEEVFALLELYRAAPHTDYLERARLVADRMIEQRYHHGFFLPGPDHLYARFDTLEPLAIVTLDAVLRGRADRIPAHIGGRGYIHGHFDGHGRTYDHRVIWSATAD